MCLGKTTYQDALKDFFFSFWFPVYGTHGTLSDKPRHTASALQTWTFPVVLPTVVMGKVKKIS